MNPFSKGSMSFDDYSYKFYNEAVLNPKTIQAINDEENTSLIAAFEVKGVGGGPGNEKDSILTTENVREFENSVHYDEEGLNDFMSKSSEKNLTKIEEVKKEDEVEEEKNKDSDKESGEASADDNHDEGEATLTVDVKKNKLTRQNIDELKYMQEKDLFEDILETKNNVKLSQLSNTRPVIVISNLCRIQLKLRIISESYRKSHSKSIQRQARLRGKCIS